MRRGITHKSQEICFFCALKLGLESSASPFRSISHVRLFQTDATLRRPGAAQAVQVEEEYDNVIRYSNRIAFSAPQVEHSRRHAPGSQPHQPVRQEPSKASETPTRPGQGLSRASSVLTGFDAFENAARAGRPPLQQRPQSKVPQAYQQPSQTSRDTRTRSHIDRLPDLPPSRGQQDFRSPFRQEPRQNFGDPFRRQDRAPHDGRQRQGSGDALSKRFDDSARQRPRDPNRQRQSHVDPIRQRFNDPARQRFDDRRQRGFGDRDQQTLQESRGPSRRVASSQQPEIDEDFEQRRIDEEEGFGQHKRLGGKKLNARESRSSRYELDDDEATPSVEKPKFVPNRLDPLEREMEEIEALMDGTRPRRKKKQKEAKARRVQPLRPRVEIPEHISVQNLAQSLGVRSKAFMERLEDEGYDGILHDHVFDASTAAMIAELYGFEAMTTGESANADLVARPSPEDQSSLPPRPPIVTIMGHVDHGKTTLLDYLRKSSVVETEHGGITQHIGAFSVVMPVTKRKITFLDTPGHAAFLDMRKRGAIVTDIVVLVVAADDGVKPQTIEAIKHATDANVQIIVAINKVDKEDSDVRKVWQDLARHEVYVEDNGGDIQAIPVSGKTGQGMDALEEAITTLADVSDFRAEIDGPSEGWIIESKVTSGGRVATVLVRRGTLRIGDFIVAGSTWARVRTLRNDAGQLVSEALPGTPVQVDGWRGEDPTAGLEVLQAEDEQHAKRVVDLRIEKAESLRAATDMVAINKTKTEETEARAKVLAWRTEQGYQGRRGARRRPRDNTGWVEGETDSGPKRVPFVIKADVAGSAEAVEAAVGAIANKEVIADVIHSGTGHLSESDIKLLATTGEKGYAISFNQSIDGTMYRLAEAAGLRILDHNIIYKVTDDVKEKLTEELTPLITQHVLGEAKVEQIFDINIKRKTIKVAGCKITNGIISKSQKIRVLRYEEVVYTGTLDTLKNIKKDVTEMRKGSECGMSFDNWDDFRIGDQIQSFEENEEKRTWY